MKILTGVLVHRVTRPLRGSVSCGSGWSVPCVSIQLTLSQQTITRITESVSEPLTTGFTKSQVLNRGSTGKKTPGGAGTQHGTHGTHGRTRAHGSHGRTSQPSTQTQRHTRTTTRRGETATDSTFRYRGQDLREPDPTPNRVRVVFLSCLGGFPIGYV